jgi:hypothetical protein
MAYDPKITLNRRSWDIEFITYKSALGDTHFFYQVTAEALRALSPGSFMNLCREAVKMGVPPGNRKVLVPRRT